MKQSIVIHVAGPLSKDIGLYLVPAETVNDPITQWSKVGLVQEIYLRATGENFIPKIIISSVGFNIKPCEKPDLSTGLVIMLQGFISFGDIACCTNSDVRVLVPVLSYVSRPGAGLLETHTILGGLKELTLSVSCIENNVICYINGFDFSGISIPSWVTVGDLPPELIK